jgi:hypothetical protein
MTTRLTALKLITIDTLLVKESYLPNAFKLNITEPLTAMQLNHLVLASPWKPTQIEAHVGDWNEDTGSFDAIVVVIETPPRIPTTTKNKKTLRWGQNKRKRGFISHD